MDPILDSVLTEVISWRLQFLEDTATDDQEFEFLKEDYLRISLKVLASEGTFFDSDVELADYLYEIFEKAKKKTYEASLALHRELDSNK